MNTDMYHSPFDGRYTSKEMNQLFSDDAKFSIWRELWVSLAKAEKRLGLDISDEQIKEMEKYVHDINYDVANAREKEVRHDVMAHVYAFEQQAKSAKGIIHLGATSCYVTDNTDIIRSYDALGIIREKLLGLIKLLADFAEKTKHIATLGYTHYQPATPTTVGKRATLWLQNFVENLDELDFVRSNMRMLGCRGATGSSETFMRLFNGNEEKCKKLDNYIAEDFGFCYTDVTPIPGCNGMAFKDVFKVYPISGQTYPRSLDFRVLNVLADIAISAHKMALDIRLLQHDMEIEEPFSENQIGSSAMAYKRNPMRCERICSLARYLGGLPIMAWETAATQMLERTLDDSAGRRVYIPDGFRAADAILILCSNVVDKLNVNKGVIKARLNAEIPFMITEDIIMESFKRGADRQEMHAEIREISLDVARKRKAEGLSASEVYKEMLNKIDKNLKIPLSYEEVEEMLKNMNLTGRCASQVTDYLCGEVYPLLEDEIESVVVDAEVDV